MNPATTPLSNPAVAHPGLVANLLSIFLYVGSEWVMYLLLCLSVISIAVALERAVYFLGRRANLSELEGKFAGLLGANQLDQAARLLETDKSMAARVAEAGLRHMSDGPEVADEWMSAALIRERAAFQRGLPFLGTLGNNAPFVGLFGTVLGIIRSFRDLAANTTQGASSVMSGIAEALVATAVGLLVALPAVAIYNYYQTYIRGQAAAADGFTHLVLAHSRLPSKAHESHEPRPALVTKG